MAQASGWVFGEGTEANFAHHRFHVLDGMRGIAAIIVVLYHYYYATFAPAFPNSFAAVDFFFILSGFVISHAYRDRLRRGMYAAEYLLRRLVRLLPMMALGISLGSLILLVAWYGGFTGYTLRDILLSAVGNFFFLPYFNDARVLNIPGPGGFTFPSDIPLWSISFEMAVSIAFLSFASFRLRSLVWVCAASFILLVLGCVYWSDSSDIGISLGYTTSGFFGGFPRVFYGFLCGMILYEISTLPVVSGWIEKLRQTKRLDARWLYAGLIVVLLFPYTLSGAVYFLILLGFAPALVFFGSKGVCGSERMIMISEKLGWLSYPVYCLHAPIHRAIHGAVEHHYLPYTFSGAMPLVGTILIAYISAKFMDRFVQKPLNKAITQAF